MCKILVTGVAGFIGSRIADRLISDGFEVIGVDDLSTGCAKNIPKDVHFIYGDLADPRALRAVPHQCQKILHLAGQSSGEVSFDDPIADLNKNTVSTLNLIQFSIERGIERLVYASSMSVYGNVPDIAISEVHERSPLSCYGVGKLAAENYLRVHSSSLRSVILRMFNVYGPGQNMANNRQGMISIYLAQALENRRIEVKGSLDRFRDFIYIDDVVDLWIQAAFNPNFIGRTLNVGTGVKTKVCSLLNSLNEIIPNCDVVVRGSTPGDQQGIYSDNKAIIELVGPKDFTSVEDGLRKFLHYLEHQV